MTQHKRKSKRAGTCGIVLAAGKSARFRGMKYKQFDHLRGTPLFIHTLKAVLRLNFITSVLVVLPSSKIQYGKRTIETWIPQPKIAIVCIAGGKTRTESTYRALRYLKDNPPSYVLIQDAARPMMKSQIAAAVHAKARKTGAAIVGRPMTDSLAYVKDSRTRKTLDRTNVYATYTPHCYTFTLIAKAHERAQKRKMLEQENADLVLLSGKPVSIVPTTGIDIKVTYPEDLATVESLLKIR